MESESALKKPVWLKVNEKEVEDLVVEIAKTEKSPEKIGLILRDKYGIPTTRLFGKKLTHILKKNNIIYESDLNKLEKKAEKIKEHLKKHHKDKKAKRAMIITSSKVERLKKYYQK